MPSRDVTITGTLTWEGHDRPDSTPPERPSRPSRLWLVQQENLLYLGAFRIPAGLGYWGAGLTYYAGRHSLYAADAVTNAVAEIGPLPEPVISTGALTVLPAAPLLQPLADATAGLLPLIIGDSGTVPQLAGLLPWNGELIVAASRYYDANSNGTLSHFVGSLTLADRIARGPYQVGAQGAGSIGGYLANVPIAWQRALGGPVLAGWTAPTIVTRTSLGPTAFALDPSDIGIVQPYAETLPLSYYPSQTGQLYDYDTVHGTSNPLFNPTSHVGGMVVCPKGTRSVLFWGDNGHGVCQYGDGAALGDEVDHSKGEHAYPYYPQVWAYDAWDLVGAQRGTNLCADVAPYAYWTFALPFPSWGRVAILGATSDDQGRIYLAQKRAGSDESVIHVYTVVASGATRSGQQWRAGGC